jgi:hypothetical protein
MGAMMDLLRAFWETLFFACMMALCFVGVIVAFSQ